MIEKVRSLSRVLMIKRSRLRFCLKSAISLASSWAANSTGTILNVKDETSRAWDLLNFAVNDLTFKFVRTR